MQKLARQVIGTNNVDNCSRYCQAPATKGLMRTVGIGGDAGGIDDLEKAAMTVLIGTNTAEAHPVIASRMKRAQNYLVKNLMYLILENMKWPNVQMHSINLNQVRT